MEKKLRMGTTLIVDRYSYSGVAFSSAKGLDIEWCKVKLCLILQKKNAIFFFFEVVKIQTLLLQAPEMGLLAPDLVLYLDIPPEVICNHCHAYKNQD